MDLSEPPKTGRPRDAPLRRRTIRNEQFQTGNRRQLRLRLKRPFYERLLHNCHVTKTRDLLLRLWRNTAFRFESLWRPLLLKPSSARRDGAESTLEGKESQGKRDPTRATKQPSRLTLLRQGLFLSPCRCRRLRCLLRLLGRRLLFRRRLGLTSFTIGFTVRLAFRPGEASASASAAVPVDRGRDLLRVRRVNLFQRADGRRDKLQVSHRTAAALHQALNMLAQRCQVTWSFTTGSSGDSGILTRVYPTEDDR